MVLRIFLSSFKATFPGKFVPPWNKNLEIVIINFEINILNND